MDRLYHLAQLYPTLTLVATALPAFGFLILLVLYALKSEPSVPAKFWASQPSVGLRKQRFAWIRATLRNTANAESLVAHGYGKVCAMVIEVEDWLA